MTENVGTIKVNDRVEVTTGLQSYGLKGTVVAMKPYAKGTLATVRARYGSATKDFDIRELRKVDED